MAREVQFVQDIMRDWRLHHDELAFLDSIMTEDLQIDWGSKLLAERIRPDADWSVVLGFLICAALCGWRKSMGIYTFDGELFSALQDSEPPDALPPLPEMTMFVFAGTDAFLVFNIWDYSNPMEDAPHAFDKLRGDQGLVPPWLAWRCVPANERAAINEPFSLVNGEEMKAVARLLGYLTTKAPDLEGPARPRAQRRNKHGLVVAQNHPAVWQVGINIGAHIRRQRAEASMGGTVRPHVRRGHFHTYLRGEGKRDRVILWTAPTFVLGGPDRPSLKTAQHGGNHAR